MCLVENGANANFYAAYAATQRGNFEVLKAVVEKGAAPNKPINNNKKQTDLTYAADRSESVLLKLLIDAGGKHDQKDVFFE